MLFQFLSLVIYSVGIGSSPSNARLREALVCYVLLVSLGIEMVKLNVSVKVFFVLTEIFELLEHVVHLGGDFVSFFAEDCYDVLGGLYLLSN